MLAMVEMPLYGLLLVLQVSRVPLVHLVQTGLTQVTSSIVCVQAAQTCQKELKATTPQIAGMTLHVHMIAMKESHQWQVTKCA